jgi:hypothetical protein
MSRSILEYRGCGHPLGQRHHTGRLRTKEGVTVSLEPRGRFGPFLRLVCPVCRRHRDYTVTPDGLPPSPDGGLRDSDFRPGPGRREASGAER